MSKYLVFENPGQISVLDLISMGDSSKREDASKIGKFDSGLKYAIAILFNNGVNFHIETCNKVFTVDTSILNDDLTSKTKEVLTVIEDDKNSNDSKTYTTGFSPKLGQDWDFWMSFREIYSNCIDENGSFFKTDSLSDIKEDTTRFIIENNSLTQETINNWNDYFLLPSLIESSNNIEIHNNNSSHLKIYKRGILIHEDIKEKSLWSYAYNDASIDEMRCMKNPSSIESSIRYTIIESENETIINTLCEHNSGFYELNIDFDYGISFNQKWFDIVNKRHLDKSLNLCNNLKKSLASDSRLEVGVRRVPTPHSIHSWDRTTVIETPIEDKIESFEDNIKSIANKFNFKIEYPIIESKINNFPVLGDSKKEVLYITSSFSEENMWQLIQAHFQIESKGNRDFVYKKYVELLKKIR